jgi:protein-L-isoaspartate O-methyltransferase
MHQDLMLINRDQQGEIKSQKILGVAFVPLIEDS